MSSQIKSSPKKSFLELVSSINFCSIPAFQRSYNWTAKQLSSLWDGVISNEAHYYIGNFVVIDKTSQDAEPYFEIIDGQQRITTINLLLIALRNIIERDKEKQKNKLFEGLSHDNVIVEINRLLFFEKGLSDNRKRACKMHFYKKNLNDIYEKMVSGGFNQSTSGADDLDDNQKRFIRNLRTFDSFIKQYFRSSSDKLKDLEILLDKIKTLEFILIVCERDSNAFRLFEGLNSTGLELSVVDLVKNAVILTISENYPRAVSQIENSWQEIENLFEEYDIKKLTKFLRHQWIAREGYVNTSDLYDKIKEKKLSGKNKDVVSYVEELKEDATVYIGFRNCDIKKLGKGIHSKYNRLFEQVIRFSWLDVEQAYAILLSYFNKYKTAKRYTENIFRIDMERLWNFSFLTKFLDISPSIYEKIFADRCESISKYAGKKYSLESDKFCRELSDLVKNKEQEFVNNFAADFTYSKANRVLIRYVLQEYLRYGESIHIKSVKKDMPSIEHILPQTPEKWKLSESEIEPYVHKIGNLTLLSYSENGSGENETFDVKYRKIYKKDVYPKNRELNKYRKSFKSKPGEAINERGRDIAGIVYKIFSIK